MKITNIQVNAGRTFNHPHEQYSNLRSDVVLNATLDEGEDPAEAVKKLQAQAEGLAEDHKQSLLTSIEELRALQGLAREVATLELNLTQGQQRLADIRQRHPELAKLPAELADVIAER